MASGPATWCGSLRRCPPTSGSTSTPRSYVLRLAECLQAEFPVLRALIGPQTFDLFAGGYLSARPPCSPSLYDLGDGFAAYLDATRPEPRSGPGTLEALPASLARLERAVSESGHARGPEGSGGAARLDVAALMSDPAFRLRTPESLRLLRLDFDFSDAFESQRAGRRPATARTAGHARRRRPPQLRGSGPSCRPAAVRLAGRAGRQRRRGGGSGAPCGRGRRRRHRSGDRHRARHRRSRGRAGLRDGGRSVTGRERQRGRPVPSGR